MGIDSNGARFLLDAAQNGVVFHTCAMLGRQEMHLTPSQLEEVLRRLSVNFSPGEPEKIIENGGGRAKGYAEKFLEKCGAKTVVSFDNSDYEGATVIHDMNHSMPPEYHGKFDCVIDSGTLEHVFNIPVALRNCMTMVKPGGHFLSITGCNNFMGHGFYQFSPELFYGILSKKNGFTVERMFIFESMPKTHWYKVSDPNKIGARVELTNSKMTYLLVQGCRLSEVGLSDITPQQSDYVPMWNGNAPSPSQAMATDHASNVLTTVKGTLKHNLKKMLKVLPVESLRTSFHRPWYEPYD